MPKDNFISILTSRLILHKIIPDILYTNMKYKMSNTDTVLVGVLGGICSLFASVGTVLLSYKIIESVDNAINPRTPEYLANQKKKQLVSWIKGDNEKIVEKQILLDGLKKYKNSEHKTITERDIKFEIEYLKRSVDRWNHEKEVIEFAFCLHQEPAPLMPVEMGYRKLFYGL